MTTSSSYLQLQLGVREVRCLVQGGCTLAHIRALIDMINARGLSEVQDLVSIVQMEMSGGCGALGPGTAVQPVPAAQLAPAPTSSAPPLSERVMGMLRDMACSPRVRAGLRVASVVAEFPLAGALAMALDAFCGNPTAEMWASAVGTARQLAASVRNLDPSRVPPELAVVTALAESPGAAAPQLGSGSSGPIQLGDLTPRQGATTSNDSRWHRERRYSRDAGSAKDMDYEELKGAVEDAQLKASDLDGSSVLERLYGRDEALLLACTSGDWEGLALALTPDGSEPDQDIIDELYDLGSTMAGQAAIIRAVASTL